MKYDTLLVGIGAISSIFICLDVYNKIKPFPICKLEIKPANKENTHIEEANFSIESANGSNINLVDIKHKNIDCLEKKGYIFNKYIYGSVTKENLFSIYPLERNKFSDDCKECNVSTTISYKSSWGNIIEEEFKWGNSMY